MILADFSLLFVYKKPAVKMVKAAQVVFVRLTQIFLLVLPTLIHTIYLENEVIVECLERSGLMDHPNGEYLH